MNDRRFIELLNLYVDQELTDDEARALEAEIVRKPERRQIYTQYCRMQRACVRLFEQQTAPAPRIQQLTAAAVAGDQEPVEFEPPRRMIPELEHRPRRGMAWAAWSGGLVAAAAACVAVVAMRQADLPTTPSSPAPAMAAVAAEATPSPAAVVAEADADRQYRPVVVVDALLRPAGVSATDQAVLEASSLDWLQEMKLMPMRRVPLETFRFEAAGAFQPLGQEALVADGSAPAVATEISAFQFQR